MDSGTSAESGPGVSVTFNIWSSSLSLCLLRLLRPRTSSVWPEARQGPLPQSWVLKTFSHDHSSPLSWLPPWLEPCGHLPGLRQQPPHDSLCSLGPILHMAGKEIFIKDTPNQVAPWLKPSLAFCCTLNKTHLLTGAPKTLRDLSPLNLSREASTTLFLTL